MRDLTGQKFGRLTVLRRAEDYISPNGKKDARWVCKCDCSDGNEIVVRGANLWSCHTQSCGCLHREATGDKHRTHGKTKSRVYRIWRDMKDRCYRENNKYYNDYGGRGITVCDEWKDSFEAFCDDVSKLPHFNESGYTLDRIDNNKNYCLENCRWATQKEQANNKRNNRIIAYNGRKKTLAQWADEYGLSASCLGLRLNRYHWDIEKALNKPSQMKPKQ